MEQSITEDNIRPVEWIDLYAKSEASEEDNLLKDLGQLVDEKRDDQPLSKAESQLISELDNYRYVTQIFQCFVCCEFLSTEPSFQNHIKQHENLNVQSSIQEEYFCALCFTTRDDSRGMAKHHIINHRNLNWTSYIVKTLVNRLSLKSESQPDEELNVSDFEEFYVTEQDLRAVGLFLEDITSSHSNQAEGRTKIHSENHSPLEETKRKGKFLKVVGNLGRPNPSPSPSPKPKENQEKSKDESKSTTNPKKKALSDAVSCEKERLRRKNERALFQKLANMFGESYEGAKDSSKYAILEKARLECFHQLKLSIQLPEQVKSLKKTRDALKLSLDNVRHQFSLKKDCDVILIDD